LEFGIWDLEFPGQAGTFLVPACPGCVPGKLFFLERVIEMKDNGALAVYVTTDDSSIDSDDPEDIGNYYWENEFWLRLIKEYRMEYRKDKDE